MTPNGRDDIFRYHPSRPEYPVCCTGTLTTVISNIMILISYFEVLIVPYYTKQQYDSTRIIRVKKIRVLSNRRRHFFSRFLTVSFAFNHDNPTLRAARQEALHGLAALPQTEALARSHPRPQQDAAMRSERWVDLSKMSRASLSLRETSLRC